MLLLEFSHLYSSIVPLSEGKSNEKATDLISSSILPSSTNAKEKIQSIVEQKITKTRTLVLDNPTSKPKIKKEKPQRRLELRANPLLYSYFVESSNFIIS